MTQAYNLSQLANNLNSSGQLDATDGLVNAVPVANGGTGASSDSAARTNLGLAIGTDIPSKTGTGASGTWSIDITGSASFATNATNAINATNATNADYATNAGNASTVTTITTSQVLTATASASAGAVGTYCFASVETTSLSFGTTVAGSSLQASGTVNGTDIDNSAYTTSGTMLSGTWRLMGEILRFPTTVTPRMSLWLRIS